MAKLYKTLNKKGEPSTEIYPNIEASNIPNNAIDSTKIQDNAITNTKIQDNAVTGTKILNNSIPAGKLSANSIATSNLQDSSVTTSKLGFHLYRHFYRIRVDDGSKLLVGIFDLITTNGTLYTDATLEALFDIIHAQTGYLILFEYDGFTIDPKEWFVSTVSGVNKYFGTIDSGGDDVLIDIQYANIADSKITTIF